MSDDAQLLRRYAEEKSEAAFAELVSRHLDLVFSAALRQVGGDVHRAHDVAQVVFTALARKAAEVAQHPVLVGWLYTATQHAAAKIRRTEARRRAREQEAHAMNEMLSSDSSAAVDWARVRPALDDAMRELNDSDRAAVLLRFFSHRPFAEIGAALDLTEDAARMRVERALDKLHAQLARRGVTSTASALAAVLANQAVAAAPAGLAASITASSLLSGASLGLVAGILNFMSATKFTFLAVAAVVIFTLGSAVYENHRRQEAVAALAAASREQSGKLAQVHAIQERQRQAEENLAALERSLADARAAAAKSAADQRATRQNATSVAPNGNRDAVAAGQELLARFPEVKKALLDRSYARIRARYTPLYATLHLTPDQIARFETLMLEQEGVSAGNSEIGSFMLRPGTGLSRQELMQGVHEVLGDEGFQQFQAGQRTGGPLQLTTFLASSLYFTDSPLTPEQAAQLSPIIMRSDAKRRSDADPRLWDQLLAEAGSVLNPTQMAALSRLRAQDEFSNAIKKLIGK